MEFGLKGLVPDKAARQARAGEQLDALGIGHLADRASHTLSGGERQLVALAAVLVMRPNVIVFDEPTTQLDLRNRNRVRAAIDSLACDAIVVSHDLELLDDYDRVLVIADGRLAADDAPGPALRWYREHCS
jgi:biotin transport system ATP-binding protein